MPPAERRDWSSGVVRSVLPNGLTVLIHPDPTAPAVSVVIHVRAGFFDEPDRWQGISHVLEHMFFKGTPTRGVGQIALETKALGGYLNAYTSYDATTYYVVLPAAGFRQALEIQADALRNAAIDAGELERELQVIIEEAKRKFDSSSARAHEVLHEVLFDHHRIRRWRIGVEGQLAGFTREDVAGYYASRYLPGRVIVSVAGAVEVGPALQAVEDLFGDWAAGPAAVDLSPEEPWRSDNRVRTLRGDVKQADLVVGWRAVPYGHPDAPALDLAASVLSAGRGGWLYRHLRQPGIVTSAGAYHYTPTEVGVFSISADLEPGRIDETLTVVGGLMARLGTTGPSDQDLSRVKTLIAAQWARRFESVDGRATTVAAAEALGGVAGLDEEYRRMMAVTAAEVRDAVRCYLRPDAVSAVVFLPDGSGPDLTVEGLRRSFEGPARSADPPSNAPTLLVSSRVRAVGVTRTAGVAHLALPGADLLVKAKPSVPLVTLGWYRRRSEPEAPGVAGVGALAVRAAARGAGPFDLAALADAFEVLGGTLGTSVAADWHGFGASVLAANRDQALQAIREVVVAPRFDPAEVAREQETMIREAVQAADDMFRRPVDLALGAAFGARGYGLPAKGTPDTLAALTLDDVRRWHGRELTQSRPLIVAVGDLDPDEALDRLGGILADLPAVPSGPASASVPWTRAEARRAEDRHKSQTALAMVFQGPSRSDPDRYAAEVLAAVASGLGGRLFYALRDQRSLAYTVMLSSWQRRSAGAIVTYIATSPEREAEARDAMLSELARFRNELVRPDELTRAVNYLAGQATVQRQTAGAQASEIVDTWLLGTGLAELDDPAAEYRRVSAEDLQRVAERYLVADGRAEGLVRGR